MRRYRLAIIAAIIVLIGMSTGGQAFAQEGSQTYSGDFWSRSTLTGDWGGVRNDWAKKGITFDINLTQIGQSNISGGKNIGWEYGGRGNITLNLDTQKMGLWPGGFFTLEVEGNYNHGINNDIGAFMPVNSNQIYPMPGSDQLNVPNVSFMQFLSHYVGLTVGKLDTTSGDANEFAKKGKGDVQFFNFAFNINPVTILITPYSTLGAGVIVLPTKDPHSAIITIMALNGDGEANRSGFDTLFKGNTTYAVEGRVKTDFFGMTGHQLVGAEYSSKNFSSLSQSSRVIFTGGSIEQKDNSWNVYYNFDQYLYEPKKGQGIGVFGRFGISDGNPNPVHHFYSIGVGGKGVIPGRKLDEFGLGYYYIDISNPKFTGPLATREFLRNEQGFEGYYDFAITPWMKLTPDMQIIRGARKDTVSVESLLPPIINRNEIKTATVLGLRLHIVF